MSITVMVIAYNLIVIIAFDFIVVITFDVIIIVVVVAFDIVITVLVVFIVVVAFNLVIFIVVLVTFVFAVIVFWVVQTTLAGWDWVELGWVGTRTGFRFAGRERLGGAILTPLSSSMHSLL